MSNRLCHRCSQGQVGWSKAVFLVALPPPPLPPAGLAESAPAPGAETALPTAGLTLHRGPHDGRPGFLVLTGPCQFGTAWAGLRLISFIHSFSLRQVPQKTLTAAQRRMTPQLPSTCDCDSLQAGQFSLGFGAGGRLPIWHGVGGFVFNSSSSQNQSIPLEMRLLNAVCIRIKFR